MRNRIGNYWGDWGISSQCAPLKSVLLRRPGSEINEFSWEEARFREGIDPDKFREAHQRLVDLYEENGVKVYFLDEQREDRPNAVYCRDLMFMTPEGAIIARPGSACAQRGRSGYGKGSGGFEYPHRQDHHWHRHL